jgi:hypothetical protein
MSTTTEPTVLDRMREQRKAKYDAWEQFVEAREAARQPFEARLKSDEFKALSEDVRDAEVQAFRDAEAAFSADSSQRKAALAEMDDNITLVEREEQRKTEAADASKRSPSTSITNEPRLYRSDNARGENGLSYYRDFAMVEQGIAFATGGTKDEARERLEQHAREVRTVGAERQKDTERRAREQIAKAEEEFLSRAKGPNVDTSALLRDLRSNGLAFNPFEQRVTPNSTDGYGGYFIPPDWLISEFIPGLRAHLIAANMPRQMDMPAGTNSILIPKLNQLTTVGYQQTNNSGLPTQDWTDTFVQANAKTIGGFSDVAIQLLEQSPGAIVDEVITQDLMAAYNLFLDQQVISGDGVSVNALNGGHIQGIYNGSGGSAWSGVNTVTFTSGAPAPYMLPPGVFGPMYGKIASTRYAINGFKVLVHGSRWAWYTNGLDANNRPLGESAKGGPFNVNANLPAQLQEEGLVGTLPTLADAPVYADQNIPTADTTGGASNADIAIGGLWDDAWLFKSPLRTEVFREVLSGTLGVRFRIYNYAAFLVRYGQSFAVASGTGFNKPSTGYGDYYR